MSSDKSYLSDKIDILGVSTSSAGSKTANAALENDNVADRYSNPETHQEKNIIEINNLKFNYNNSPYPDITCKLCSDSKQSRIDCFVKKFKSFINNRGILVTETQLKHLENHLNDGYISFEKVLLISTPLHGYAEKEIMLKFSNIFYKMHPKFQQECPISQNIIESHKFFEDLF